MDRGGWQATVHGVAKRRPLLSVHTHADHTHSNGMNLFAGQERRHRCRNRLVGALGGAGQAEQPDAHAPARVK